jgi:hypothetical protein
MRVGRERGAKGTTTHGTYRAPANGDEYSMCTSPGRCFATTVIEAGKAVERRYAVVRPLTPALRVCQPGRDTVPAEFPLLPEAYPMTIISHFVGAMALVVCRL